MKPSTKIQYLQNICLEIKNSFEKNELRLNDLDYLKKLIIELGIDIKNISKIISSAMADFENTNDGSNLFYDVENIQNEIKKIV